MARVDVTTEVLIRRPREGVAAFATDPDNATRWYRNITSVEWRSERPLKVGTRLAFVARFLGRVIAYTYEVRELVPGERFVMSTRSGPFPMETTYEFHEAEGGATRMILRNRGEPSGFARVAGPAMAAAMRRANRKDLDLLRRLLESPGAPTTPA